MFATRTATIAFCTMIISQDAHSQASYTISADWTWTIHAPTGSPQTQSHLATIVRTSPGPQIVWQCIGTFDRSKVDGVNCSRQNLHSKLTPSAQIITEVVDSTWRVKQQPKILSYTAVMWQVDPASSQVQFCVVNLDDGCTVVTLP